MTDLEYPSSPAEQEAYVRMAGALNTACAGARARPLVIVLLPRVPRSADARHAEFLEDKRRLAALAGPLLDSTGSGLPTGSRDRSPVFDDASLLSISASRWDTGQDLDRARARVIGVRLSGAQREVARDLARRLARAIGLDSDIRETAWVLTRPLPHPLFLGGAMILLVALLSTSALSGRYMSPSPVWRDADLAAELLLVAGTVWAFAFLAHGGLVGDTSRFATLGPSPDALAMWVVVVTAGILIPPVVAWAWPGAGARGLSSAQDGLSRAPGRAWWCRRDANVLIQGAIACSLLVALTDPEPISTITSHAAVFGTAGPCALMAACIVTAGRRRAA
jgi:hypothetical protein